VLEAEAEGLAADKLKIKREYELKVGFSLFSALSSLLSLLCSFLSALSSLLSAVRSLLSLPFVTPL
jgi:hypothetical protein